MVETSTGIIEVEYCDTQFGHASNIGCCWLTAEDHALLEGISYSWD